MFRPLILLFAAGITSLSLGVAQPAQAQDWSTFDCARLLVETGFDSLSDRDVQIAGEFQLSYNLSPVPTNDDPVNADEFLSPGGKLPLLARSAPVSTGNIEETLGCNLIIVEFSSTADRLKLSIRDSDGNPVGNRLAIVLADLFKSSVEEEKRFESWREAKFAISTKLESFNSAGITFLNLNSFDKVPYLTKTVWNDNSVRFVSTANAPQDVKDFLGKYSAETPMKMVVLCGTGDCTKIRTSLEPFSNPPQTDLGTEYVSEPSQPAAGGGMGEHNDVSQAQTDAEGLSGPESVTSLPMQLNLTVLDGKGQESARYTDKLAKVGGIECILSAINSDLFESAPTCPNTDFRELKDANALIRVTHEGQWQIVPNARFRDPKAIEVALPEDQSTAGCLVDVSYIDKNKTETRVKLETEDGKLFFRTLDVAPIRDGNEVTFTLLPQPGAAACGGGVERIVTVQAEETVKIPLLEKPPLSRAVVHTFVLNINNLADIGLTQDDVTKLGRSVLDAVESAHQRAAATRSDTAWALTSADVGFLNETGTIEPLVRLNATQLREQVINTFSGITETNGDSISSFSPAMAAERLKQALLPVVDSARMSGVDELTVTLIAPVTSRSEVGLSDPCTDPLYNTLPSDLSNDGGPSVQVAVFPLVRLWAGDTVVDLTKLRALSDGLYACRNTPVGLSIYPFFLEEWRPGVDVSSRYATALSDRLADLIDALVSDKQVSK